MVGSDDISFLGALKCLFSGVNLLFSFRECKCLDLYPNILFGMEAAVIRHLFASLLPIPHLVGRHLNERAQQQPEVGLKNTEIMSRHLANPLSKSGLFLYACGV